ncbi:MAG: zinc metallopeptidase [Clostridia bacterium]|nr:zinc metallopeptidase [Clostridia bacterium]
MFLEYYWIVIVSMLVCAVIGGYANNKVHSAYRKYGAIATRSHMTGYDTAKKLLRANGIHGISVGRTKGVLSDHFHPKKREVNLSEGVYGSDSLAAVAVAAHEIGHVVQKEKGYAFYKLRTVMVGLTNFGSRLALPLVLLGVLLEIFVGEANPNVGFYVALGGVALYGLSTVFALITLPVELDASRRAKKMLVEQGIITEEELPYASKMLGAAASTYVASLLVSLIYFLRFAMWVLVLFGQRRRD